VIAMSLLSADDEQRIEAKIAEIERRTAGEIVVAVVARSGEYALGRAAVAFAAALCAALALFEFRPDLPPEWGLLLELVVALAAYWLLGIGGLERLLVPPRVADARVSSRAFSLFAERGIHRTVHHTGILVFLSELEHRVVILGDVTIHERLGQQGWQAHVDHIVQAIRRGDASRGILEVLERLGDVLAELVPAGAMNADELPNRVVRDA
jgi:putative membrane protein